MNELAVLGKSKDTIYCVLKVPFAVETIIRAADDNGWKLLFVDWKDFQQRLGSGEIQPKDVMVYRLLNLN